MVGTKTTGLATGTPDPAADWLSFVDVSDTTMAASGTNKKVVSDNLRVSMANGAPGSVSRTMKDKLGEIFSVKDLGADPTGIGDSSPAFTTAAQSGRRYLVPPGTYKLNSTVTCTTGCWLEGETDAGVFINPAADVDAFLIDATASSPSDFVFKNLRINIVSTAYVAGRMNVLGMKLGRCGWVLQDTGSGRDPHWIFSLHIERCQTLHSSSAGNRVGAGFLYSDGALLYTWRIMDCQQQRPVHGISRKPWKLQVIAAGAAVASTDTITLAGHGYTNGKKVAFAIDNLLQAQDIGITPRKLYYVVGAATDTFQVSLTSGGSAVNITADNTIDIGVALVDEGSYSTDRWEMGVIDGFKNYNVPTDEQSTFAMHNCVNVAFQGRVEIYPVGIGVGICNWPYKNVSFRSTAVIGAIYNPFASGRTNMTTGGVLEGAQHDLRIAHGPLLVKGDDINIRGCFHINRTQITSAGQTTLLQGSRLRIENTSTTGNWNSTATVPFVEDRGTFNEISNTAWAPPYQDGITKPELAIGYERPFDIGSAMRGLDYPQEHFFIPGMRCGQSSAAANDVSYLYDATAHTKQIFRQNIANGAANFWLKAPSGRDYVPTVNLPVGYYLFRFRVRTSNNASAPTTEFRLRYGVSGAATFTNIINQTGLTYPNTYAVYEYMVNLSALVSTNWPLCLTFVGAAGNDWLLDWAALIPVAALGWEDQGAAAPTVGQWPAGWRRWKTAPATAASPGWICTTAGTPGTWTAMAALA